MSLTLLYRGKNVRFSMKLNKLHWLSALAAFALFSGVLIHLIFSNDAIPDHSLFGLTNFSAQESQSSQSNHTSNLSKLSKLDMSNNPVHNTPEVIALTLKLAELQSHVYRLDALGNRLADEANIPQEEFDFSVAPPSGGPSYEGQNSAENPPILNEGKSFAQMLLEVTALEDHIANKEKQLTLLESLILGHHIENTRYLSGRPISRGWLSSDYGMRKDPFNGKPAMHKGVDFAGKEGAAVIATASGVVSWADNRYGYGQMVEINHGDGLKTRYGHNQKLLVKVGDVVTKGQVVALMGSTGRSTGPHVHYEILQNNVQINPIKFVNRQAK